MFAQESVMDIQKDKDFTSLPEIAKLYQACKERDLTIAEREYLKGARDAWQATKSQAVPEGFVLVPKDKISHFYQDNDEPENFCNSSNDWDCLGEGMDIQKEKIAHEKHLLSQGVDFKYLPNIQYSELENVYELIEWDEEYSEALNEINSSWCTWQAAKAQVVPEGFVVLKISDVREILSNASDAMDAESPSSVFTQTGIPSTWYDHHLVAEKNILDAIKAQEQVG